MINKKVLLAVLIIISMISMAGASMVRDTTSDFNGLNATLLNVSGTATGNYPNNTVASKEAIWDAKPTNQSINPENVNAYNITSGTIDDSRLGINVSLETTDNRMTGINKFLNFYVRNTSKGDTDNDGIINMSDVNYLQNSLAWPLIYPCTVLRCDIDGDMAVDIGDLPLLRNIILFPDTYLTDSRLSFVSGTQLLSNDSVTCVGNITCSWDTINNIFTINVTGTGNTSGLVPYTGATSDVLLGTHTVDTPMVGNASSATVYNVYAPNVTEWYNGGRFYSHLGISENGNYAILPGGSVYDTTIPVDMGGPEEPYNNSYFRNFYGDGGNLTHVNITLSTQDPEAPVNGSVTWNGTYMCIFSDATTKKCAEFT